MHVAGQKRKDCVKCLGEQILKREKRKEGDIIKVMES